MSSLKILTAAIAAATFSLAFAQGTPPRPATDPAVGAGQRSSQNTPMGSTGTPGAGGGMAQGGTSAGGAAAATAGSANMGTTGSGASMNAGTTTGARAGGTAVAQDTHTHTHKAAKSKKKAKRVKADRG